MKTVAIFVGGLLVSASSSFAANANGNVSRDALARMGLREIRALPDAQGLAIRGTPACICPTERKTYVIQASAQLRFVFQWRPEEVYFW